MKTELECRLLECDVDSLIVKLQINNAQFVGDFLQVRNCYDFNPIKENSWIRLRTNGIETTLTIKEIANAKIDGTKECEIVVSDFNTTDELLNKLGYFARSKQENRRIRYMLDNVEIDIDFWPLIPTYVEFEAPTQQDIENVCNKLGIDFNTLTTMDVNAIYTHYGYDLNTLSVLKLENDRKINIVRLLQKNTLAVFFYYSILSIYQLGIYSLLSYQLSTNLIKSNTVCFSSSSWS